MIVQADVVIERDNHIAEVPPDVDDREPVPSNRVDVRHVRPDVHLCNERPVQERLDLCWNEVLLSVSPIVLRVDAVDAEIQRQHFSDVRRAALHRAHDQDPGVPAADSAGTLGARRHTRTQSKSPSIVTSLRVCSEPEYLFGFRGPNQCTPATRLRVCPERETGRRRLGGYTFQRVRAPAGLARL